MADSPQTRPGSVRRARSLREQPSHCGWLGEDYQQEGAAADGHPAETGDAGLGQQGLHSTVPEPTLCEPDW